MPSPEIGDRGIVGVGGQVQLVALDNDKTRDPPAAGSSSARTQLIIKVLHLANVATDAEPVVRTLHAAAPNAIVTRVDSRDAFIKALDEVDPDAVMLDCDVPDFDGLSALKLVRAKRPDLPVIILAGALGDAAAAEFIDAGATDYVLNGQLGRLAFAVRHAAAEAEEYRKRTAAEAATAEASIRYRRLFEAAKDGILIVDFETGRILDANPFIAELLGYTLEELKGKALWGIGEFASIGLNRTAFAALQNQGYLRYDDLPLETKHGRRAEVEFVSNVYDVNGRKTIQCNIRDITDRKQMEAMQRQFAAIVEFVRRRDHQQELGGGYHCLE